ncbi:MAG: hypothetical protein V7785_02495 [Bermanella sp.]
MSFLHHSQFMAHSLKLFTILLTLISQPALSKSINPEQFSDIWHSGNKFRLMRYQSSVINPESKHFKTSSFAVNYYETYNSFQVEEDKGPVEAKIASFKADLYSQYAFMDIGAMDIREYNNSQLRSSQYSRVSTGVRYNDLKFMGLTAGLLITESPATNSQGEFVFDEHESSVDGFISFSLLGFQLMANNIRDENLIVETSSYDLNLEGYSFSLVRSKLHDNGSGSDAKKYDDEYVFNAFKNTGCASIASNVKSYCGIGLNRRETLNDQSQGWSVYLQRPFYSIRINSFDEQTQLRREKFGYSLKLGFDVQSQGTDQLTNKPVDARIKLAFGIHMNDGVNQLFEAQDEAMVGFDFEVIFP